MTAKKKAAKKKTDDKRPNDQPKISIEHLDIHARLSHIMREIGSVERTGKAPDKIGGFVFRSIDEVEGVLQPKLVKYRVAAYPSVVEYDSAQHGKMAMTEVLMEIEFVNLDAPDQVVRIRSVGQGLDSGDKGFGKAMSYATKNAYLTFFHLKGQPDVESEDLELSDSDGGDRYNTGKPMHVIPFGKYEGEHVKDLDDQKLKWIVENWADSKPDIALAAREQLEFRDDVRKQEAAESENQDEGGS